MPSTAIRRYTGQGVKPAIRPNDAVCEAGKLAPGTYAAGTVLGSVSTITAANDVQTITVTGTPTGGSFHLSFDGVLIGPVAYNASAAALQALLDAASNIGAGNATVTGGALPGAALVVTFGGSAGNLPQPVFLVVSSALTGGTDPAVAVAHTTTGRALGGILKAYDADNTDGSEIPKAIVEQVTTVNPYGEHLSGGGEWGSRQLSAPIWIGGYFRTADLTGIDSAGITAANWTIVEGNVENLSSTGTIVKLP